MRAAFVEIGCVAAVLFAISNGAGCATECDIPVRQLLDGQYLLLNDSDCCGDLKVDDDGVVVRDGLLTLTYQSPGGREVVVTFSVHDDIR